MASTVKEGIGCSLEHQLCISEEGNLTITDYSTFCFDVDKHLSCLVLSSKATSINTAKELVPPQQCHALGNDDIIMSVPCCPFSSVHPHSPTPCMTNTCLTLEDCPGYTMLLENHLKEAAHTEGSSLLGSNSTIGHGNELAKELTKRNNTHHQHNHQHNHHKKPFSHPPSTLYIAIVVPVVIVAILIGGSTYLYFARRRDRRQKKDPEQAEQQEHQQENDQTTAMEMGALEPRREEGRAEDLGDDTQSATAKEMGAQSRPLSTSSTVITRRRSVPWPPPSSPPPNRPLPPIPTRKPKNPPVVAEGHGGEDELEMLPQWHLIYDTIETSSIESKD